MKDAVYRTVYLSSQAAKGGGIRGTSFLEKQEGLLLFRLVKRGYHIDMEQIKEGLPPLKITRIVKSVKYMLYWEFDTKENYGAAQKIFITAIGNLSKSA